MVSITSDAASLVQLQDAFSSVTGNKAYITEHDMRVAQLPEDQVTLAANDHPFVVVVAHRRRFFARRHQVQYLLSVLPPTEGGYDFKAWLSAQFGVAQ